MKKIIGVVSVGKGGGGGEDLENFLTATIANLGYYADESIQDYLEVRKGYIVVPIDDITKDPTIQLSDNTLPWSYNDKYLYEEKSAYCSPDIGHNTQSIQNVTITPTEDTEYEILYTCTSEAVNKYDYLILTIDATTVESNYSLGNTTTYTWKSYAIKGIKDVPIEIKATYRKDGSGVGGKDAAGFVIAKRVYI